MGVKMNGLYIVNMTELTSIMQGIQNDKTIFVAELQGENIQSWNDYSAEIEKIFHFPSPCRDSVDRYLDWIRDLSWFDDDFFRARYIVIIYNFSHMLVNNIPIRDTIKNTFFRIILPWWDGEIEKFVVEGRRKQFDVYLVD